MTNTQPPVLKQRDTTSHLTRAALASCSLVFSIQGARVAKGSEHLSKSDWALIEQVAEQMSDISPRLVELATRFEGLPKHAP